MRPEITKRCKGCGEDKPHSEYHIHQSNADVLRSKCKTCRSAENKANKERNRPYFAEYHKRNARRICERVNAWRSGLSGEKLKRYSRAVAEGGKRFRKTRKGELSTTKGNMSKLTGIPIDMIDDGVVEAKAEQLRLTRLIRSLKKGAK